jgi:hypothetical protein
MRYLEYLASKYPKMVELIIIGHSYEGQPIKMAKVSTGLQKNGDRKPAIWIDAGKFSSSSAGKYKRARLSTNYCMRKTRVIFIKPR